MPRYPYTPEVLDALPEELAELFRELELTLLREICSRLKVSGQLNEVTVQDIRALRAHGIDPEAIKAAIDEATAVGMDKLEGLLDEVVERNQAYYTGMADLARVTAPERLVDERDIAAIRRQTLSAYKNITGSMGFLTVEGGRLHFQPPAKAYQWALDSAALQVQSGAFSYNQAIASAVKQLADRGLCVAFDKNGKPLKDRVAYESGHIDHLDVAVRRAVMTGVNQLNQKYREQSMDYLETDLVEVTAHLGARNIPGPLGFEAHSEWQGKVYRWDAKPRASTGEYPDFVEKCGYGHVQGIGGANCRHSFWPYIEGVSQRTYTDEQLEAMKPENRPKIEFEGVKYDDYQATQMQRRIERTIRKWKRRKAACEAAGLTDDAIAAGARIAVLSEKYKAFSKAAGLPEQPERMRALEGFRTTNPVFESDVGDTVRRAAKSIVTGEKVVEFDGLPKEMRRSFREGLVRATPEAQAALRQIYRQADYVVSDGKRSYYSKGPVKNIIHVGTNATPSTLAHELFHNLDKGHKISRTFTESLERDRTALNAVSGGNIREYLLREYPKAFGGIAKSGQQVMIMSYRGIADILNGLSGGKESYGFKHTIEYWAEPGALESEAWAQFGRVQYENVDEVLEMFKGVFPNFYKDAIIALRRLM